NAFTGKEITCYYAHILDEHLSIAVDILSDILVDSIFDESEMEKEKQVILEELSTLEETPEEIIHDYFIEDLFPEHSLGLPTIGKRDTISSFQRRHLLDYIKSKYTADRLIIAAAGNIEHNQLVRLMDGRLQSVSVSQATSYASPSHPARGQRIIENGAIQAHICLGTQAYSYKDPKKFALLVLNTLLGSGMSSRLFQNIREKHGLAYSIYSYIDFLVDTGLFGVYVGTDKSKIDDSIELIRKELHELMRSPISSNELQRTKSQLKGNLMLGLEGTASRMNRLARMELYLQNYYSLDDTLREIEKVKESDVLDVANELFSDDRVLATILKPKMLSDATEGRIES
ncbi:insulinase family protein, partial [bacterium]|nr:insulinase family protein [bacterium]